MTIKLLQIFVIVYQQMNITRAAELLNMAQPAVSRSIKELESYLNISLFERINHRLVSTEGGRELYSHAIHILEAFHAAEEKMSNWNCEGRIRIGATITIGNFLLPGLVKRFKDLNPKLNIQVVISNNETIQQGILENTIDIALVEGNLISEKIVPTYLATDRLCLIMSPGHELAGCKHISLSQLSSFPFLAREKGSAGRSLIDSAFELHGLSIKPSWESTSTQAIIKAVKQGLGIAILPEQLVSSEIKSGRIVTREVEDETFQRKNYIIIHKQKLITPMEEAFMKMALSYSKETPEKDIC